MAPYYVIFSLLALFALSDSIRVRRDQRGVLLVVAAVVLIAFAGLRYESPDWSNYKNGFEEMSVVGFDYARFEYSQYFEPLYNLTVYGLALTTGHYVWLFLVVAAVAVSLNLSFYKRYSPYFLLAALLYFVHTYLGRETMQIRAGVAAGLCLWSLRFVDERKPWKFVLMVAAAMGFHLASVVFLLVYPVNKFDFSRKTWSYLVGGCFAVGMVFPFGKMLSLLPTGGVFERVQAYSYMLEQQASGILNNPTTLKQLFIVVVCLCFWNTLKANTPHFKLLVVPMAMSVCWLMVWNDFPIVAARMATFFSVTEVLVYPMLLNLVSDRSKPIVAMVLILFAFSTLFLNLATEKVLPYQFLLSQ